MQKNLTTFILSLLLALPQMACAQENSVRFSDIQPQLESILADLSKNIDQFEEIQSVMDTSAKANQNYNEQKNIYLSSVLAISTISAICEYEANLLTLFIDLREKNRRKYYDVRIESMQISIQQINTMYKQIQISYTIFPPNFFEAPLVRKERLSIQSSLELLNRSIDLLKSVNQK